MNTAIAKHQLRNLHPNNVRMLLPIGYHLHSDILKLKKGDTVFFDDGEKAEFVSCCEMPYPNPITETESIGIYGFPSKVIFDAMMRNHNGQMFEDRMLLLIVKTNDNEKM